MASPKICGIDDEYGLAIRFTTSEARDEYAEELLDIDGSPKHDFVLSFVETASHEFGHGYDGERNITLLNGGRIDIDCGHPEVSMPEVRDLRSLVRYAAANDYMMLEVAQLWMTKCPGVEINVVRNNVDHKGNTYGTHDSLLIEADNRSLTEDFFQHLVESTSPYFVSSVVLFGSGKVGDDRWRTFGTTKAIDDATFRARRRADLSFREASAFQISQKADAVNALAGGHTTDTHPILTRFAADYGPDQYRRVHIPFRDAHTTPRQLALRMGTTALVLEMFEDGNLWRKVKPKFKSPTDAIASLYEFSRDLTLTHRVETRAGHFTALEIQSWYLDEAKKFHDRVGFRGLPRSDVEWVLANWEKDIEDLRTNLRGSEQIAWVRKLNSLDRLLNSRTDGLATIPELRKLRDDDPDLWERSAGQDDSPFRRLIAAEYLDLRTHVVDYQVVSCDDPYLRYGPADVLQSSKRAPYGTRAAVREILRRLGFNITGWDTAEHPTREDPDSPDKRVSIELHPLLDYQTAQALRRTKDPDKAGEMVEHFGDQALKKYLQRHGFSVAPEPVILD